MKIITKTTPSRAIPLDRLIPGNVYAIGDSSTYVMAVRCGSTGETRAVVLESGTVLTNTSGNHSYIPVDAELVIK